MIADTERQPSGTVLLRVQSALTVRSGAEFRGLIEAALQRGDRQFVVDFSRTGFIDTAGAAALVMAARRVREDGGELRVAGLNEELQALFELGKLQHFFTISPTAADALAGL